MAPSQNGRGRPLPLQLLPPKYGVFNQYVFFSPLPRFLIWSEKKKKKEKRQGRKTQEQRGKQGRRLAGVLWKPTLFLVLQNRPPRWRACCPNAPTVGFKGGRPYHSISLSRPLPAP